MLSHSFVRWHRSERQGQALRTRSGGAAACRGGVPSAGPVGERAPRLKHGAGNRGCGPGQLPSVEAKGVTGRRGLIARCGSAVRVGNDACKGLRREKTVVPRHDPLENIGIDGVNKNVHRPIGLIPPRSAGTSLAPRSVRVSFPIPRSRKALARPSHHRDRLHPPSSKVSRPRLGACPVRAPSQAPLCLGSQRPARCRLR